MAEATEILDVFRMRFGSVDAALADIKADIGEMRSRAGRLERGGADLHVQLAEHSVPHGPDRRDVDRIKRRLDLVDVT